VEGEGREEVEELGDGTDRAEVMGRKGERGGRKMCGKGIGGNLAQSLGETKFFFAVPPN